MRLVVADDHRMFLDALSAGLVMRGYDVVGTSDRLDGLVELVETWQPEMCLLDVDFGGRSVLETAATIRQRDPGIALVLLTGEATPDVWSAFDLRTVDAVLSKLCDISVVTRAIERVRAGERVVERFSRPARRRFTQPVGTRLSGRERAVVELLVRGASTEEMSAELGISTHTVRTHVQNVMRKLGVNSRAKVASRVGGTGINGTGSSRGAR
jgi:DNA-binding NarL/FixJ family response regulator